MNKKGIIAVIIFWVVIISIIRLGMYDFELLGDIIAAVFGTMLFFGISIAVYTLFTYKT